MSYPSGHAPHKTEFSLDLEVCDGCGASASYVRDMSIQLPDYRGYCEACIILVDVHRKLKIEEQKEVYRLDKIKKLKTELTKLEKQL